MTLALRLGVLLLGAFAAGGGAFATGAWRGRACRNTASPCTANRRCRRSFDHPRYANPAAPKGGRLTQGVLGTFDSLNPFIVKGLALSQVRGYVVESLLARGYDEPFTLYGLLARTVETDADRSYVTFALDPAAKFSDGKPVTAEDVIFSWQLLRDKGRPNYRTYYVKVAKAEALSERVVRFDLTGANDRELPLILGLMPVLPKHAVNPDTFEDTTFEPIVGSGPYVVAKVDAGRSISLKRNPNYWGRDLAINRGLWNFDEVRFDFYRDGNSHLEAFKKGLYDVRTETDPGRWETAYDVPAVRDGRIVKETFPYGLPKVFSGLVFNTRRPVFSDVRVREAIGMLLDFEWINHNYFYDRYRRSASYFEGSELSARGRPACRASARCSHRFRTPCVPMSWRAHGSRRHPTPPAATGARSSARSRYWTRPATRSTGRCCARARRESRSPSKSWSPRGIRSGWHLRFRATWQARRHCGPRARGRRRAIRPAATHLRLRHDRKSVGPVAFARQRAGVLLVVRRGRCRRHPQLHGRQKFRDRRHDRGAVEGPRARRVYRGGAYARPRADVGILRRPALSPAGAVGGAWITIAHPAETSLFGYLPETWWHAPPVQGK